MTTSTAAQERAERIRTLRESGMTMRAIAAELGCSVGTVHYALKAHLTSPLTSPLT